jgi:hypothetical protein
MPSKPKHPLRFTNKNKFTTLPHGLTLYRLPHNAIIKPDDWFTAIENTPKLGLMPVRIDFSLINSKVSKHFNHFAFYRVAK